MQHEPLACSLVVHAPRVRCQFFVVAVSAKQLDPEFGRLARDSLRLRCEETREQISAAEQWSATCRSNGSGRLSNIVLLRGLLFLLSPIRDRPFCCCWFYENERANGNYLTPYLPRYRARELAEEGGDGEEVRR